MRAYAAAPPEQNLIPDDVRRKLRKSRRVTFDNIDDYRANEFEAALEQLGACINNHRPAHAMPHKLYKREMRCMWDGVLTYHEVWCFLRNWIDGDEQRN